jgi:hypothetical protein
MERHLPAVSPRPERAFSHLRETEAAKDPGRFGRAEDRGKIERGRVYGAHVYLWRSQSGERSARFGVHDHRLPSALDQSLRVTAWPPSCQMAVKTGRHALLQECSADAHPRR